MKKINFIQPLSPSHARELRIWHRLVAGVALLIPLLLIISSVQLAIWIKVHRQKNELTTQLEQFTGVLTQQKNDRMEQQQLQQKIDTIERYRHDPKNPVYLLAAVMNAIKNGTTHALTITSKLIELQIHAPSVETILATMERLGEQTINDESLMDDIRLVSLTTSGSSVHATMQAIPTCGLHQKKYDRTRKKE